MRFCSLRDARAIRMKMNRVARLDRVSQSVPFEIYLSVSEENQFAVCVCVCACVCMCVTRLGMENTFRLVFVSRLLQKIGKSPVAR